MLTLPETLLLFALHGERGTIHASAFMGLDDALRGAVIAELYLRGAIQVKHSGESRRAPDPTSHPTPLLSDALLDLPDTGSIDSWLATLESTLPNVRMRLVNGLVTKGILEISEKDRVNLEDSQVFSTANPLPEAEMIQHLHAAVDAGESMKRRQGMLVGLVHALELWSALLDPDKRERAREMGEWVLGRDAICRGTYKAVQIAQGTWEN